MGEKRSLTMSAPLKEPKSHEERERLIAMTKERVAEKDVETVLAMLGIHDGKIFEQSEGEQDDA